jgi:hypothetical protein
VEGVERRESVVDRVGIGDDVLPVPLFGLQAREACFPAVDRGEPVGLVDGDGAQPAEDRLAVGLASQQDGPGRLAGVLDELARCAHDVRNRAVQVVVMPLVEVVLVATRRRWCAFGRGLHEPRPVETDRRVRPRGPS